MTEELQTIRNKLTHISQNKAENMLERRIADFYLTVLKPYDNRVLKRQGGFGRGVGGTGDNIIIMPIVERDETGVAVDDLGNPKTVRCVFDDFHAYLDYIEKRLPVKRCISRWKILPACVNGLTVDEYQAIWQRSQGIDPTNVRE